VGPSLANTLAFSMHDEVTRVLFALALVLLLARLAGQVAVAWKLPPVLGELTVGVLLGNLTLVGIDALEFIRDDAVLEVLAQVGIVLLLFSVGLQSELRKLLAVGASALRVAFIGVVVPFLLGFGTSRLFLPLADPLVHVFVGATLCATSVGISARVLQDLGRVESREGEVILGAAVVDDVLGLLILGVVTALAAQRASGMPLEFGMVAIPLATAMLFFALVVPAGLFLSPRLFASITGPPTRSILLVSALFLCFAFAALANVAGLAAIVGAFAAGVAMDDAHYAHAAHETALPSHHGLEDLVDPLVGVFAPIFFVVVGMRVDLTALLRFEVLAFAATLTVVAVVGKMLCGVGVREPGIDRSAVGLGMIPRGEVGMIFAGVGATTLIAGEPILDGSAYAALILTVFATTIATPPLLARALERGKVPPPSEAPTR
jgi:Kef-type K+ transport system membrane component KefB